MKSKYNLAVPKLAKAWGIVEKMGKSENPEVLGFHEELIKALDTSKWTDAEDQMLAKVTERANYLRHVLDMHFAKDTAQGKWNPDVPSTGHCAVAAIIGHWMFRWRVGSSIVNQASHWYNMAHGLTIDITGDQFGKPEVQVSRSILYPHKHRVRAISEANEETIRRANLLAQRAGLVYS